MGRKKSRRHYDRTGVKWRPVVKISNPSIVAINSIIKLGRLVIPPPGTRMQLVRASVPWEFLVTSWVRGEVELQAGKIRAIVGLNVTSIESNGAFRGMHVVPLDSIEQSEILELPEDAPNVMDWPVAFFMGGARIEGMGYSVSCVAMESRIARLEERAESDIWSTE